jgi:lipoprotein-releasing system ATP-binding protein
MKPDKGSINLDGHPYSSLSNKEQATFRNQKLGFVFQFHNLLGEFSCEENIKFPLLIKGEKLTESDEVLFEKIIQTLGIKDILKKIPSQISGGEQQRVAVARALINRPTLLLADEPTGNLDEHTADIVLGEFMALVREEGSSAIVATHNERLAAKMDRVVRLQEGRLG